MFVQTVVKSVPLPIPLQANHDGGFIRVFIWNRVDSKDDKTSSWIRGKNPQFINQSLIALFCEVTVEDAVYDVIGQGTDTGRARFVRDHDTRQVVATHRLVYIRTIDGVGLSPMHVSFE